MNVRKYQTCRMSGYSCHTCGKSVHRINHFVADDGRVLCYKCRTKEKAKPSIKSLVSPLGIKPDEMKAIIHSGFAEWLGNVSVNKLHTIKEISDFVFFRFEDNNRLVDQFYSKSEFEFITKDVYECKLIINSDGDYLSGVYQIANITGEIV